MAEALFKVLKWRWLAKRVFSYSASPSPTTSTSTSTSPPKPSSSNPSPPKPKTSSPPYWPFGRLFSFKLFRPALPAPPPKPESKDTEQAPASSSSRPPDPAPDTPALAPQATPPPSIPSPLSIPSPSASPPPPVPASAAPTEASPVPLQLPTPPSTPPPPPSLPRQPYLSHLPPLPPIKMSSDIATIHAKLVSSFTARTHTSTLPLLNTAKLALLKQNALVPTSSTPQNPQLLSQARDILEIGALTSIYLTDSETFARYYAYLQPFYKLPTSLVPASQQEGKILGLYLLFLLSEGDAAGFHSALEQLNQEGNGDSEKGWQWGDYVRYPVTLERWLMEGSYDKVWEATRKNKTPTEEFDVFTKVLVSTLRREIATSAQRAYPSLPIANAKNLLFLDTEKEVLQFSQQRGWEIRDGRIYFPPDEEYDGVDIPDTASVVAAKSAIHSGTIIENTIGYANELEQIV